MSKFLSKLLRVCNIFQPDLVKMKSSGFNLLMCQITRLSVQVQLYLESRMPVTSVKSVSFTQERAMICNKPRMAILLTFEGLKQSKNIKGSIKISISAINPLRKRARFIHDRPLPVRFQRILIQNSGTYRFKVS